jgi:hypothetical protein
MKAIAKDKKVNITVTALKIILSMTPVEHLVVDKVRVGSLLNSQTIVKLTLLRNMKY